MNSTVYSIITDKIVKMIETEKVLPWNKPWNSNFEIPRNFVTKKPYRGFNVFFLAMSGWDCPYWATFNQIKAKGGSVKEGEKGSLVVFWNPVITKKNDLVDSTYEDDSDTEKEETTDKKYFMLRYYTVFNIRQTSIVWEAPKNENEIEFTPIEKCETIVKEYKTCPVINENGSGASYNTSTDEVKMPKKEKFHSVEEYYSTLFHELTHSTGSESRLKRFKTGEIGIFGSEVYSKEELIAEMGASFLCGLTGIENKTINNSAAYIQGWVKKLKDDNTLIIKASSAAQKSTDYITNNEKI